MIQKHISLRTFALINICLLITAPVSFALDRTVATTGECKRDVVTDRASVSFVVEKVDFDVKKAIAQATALYEKLRSALLATKSRDLLLTTTEYSVNEKREWVKDRSIKRGYAARIGVRATTSEIADASKLIGASAGLGIEETNSFSTYLSDEKELEEKKKCLEIAVTRARDKAESLARAAGAKIGKVVTIVEHASQNQGTPRAFESAKMMSDAPAGATIDAGKQSVAYEVDAVFFLE